MLKVVDYHEEGSLSEFLEEIWSRSWQPRLFIALLIYVNQSKMVQQNLI